MRFTVTGEWTRNRLLMLVLAWFAVFSVLLWVTNGMLYFQSMDLSPASVVAHYLGDEASFRSPRSLRMLLEISHFHLFAMGLMLLTWAHLLLFVPVAPRVRARLVNLVFASALLDEAAGWLVRFASPAFAPAKVAGFLGLQLGSLAIFLLVAWAGWHGARSGYRDGEPAESTGGSTSPNASG